MTQTEMHPSQTVQIKIGGILGTPIPFLGWYGLVGLYRAVPLLSECAAP